jgi:hypothetical protein
MNAVSLGPEIHIRLHASVQDCTIEGKILEDTSDENAQLHGVPQQASAAEWAADLFVSADRRQCSAARNYGLKVEELPMAFN